MKIKVAESEDVDSSEFAVPLSASQALTLVNFEASVAAEAGPFRRWPLEQVNIHAALSSTVLLQYWPYARSYSKMESVCLSAKLMTYIVSGCAPVRYVPREHHWQP